MVKSTDNALFNVDKGLLSVNVCWHFDNFILNVLIVNNNGVFTVMFGWYVLDALVFVD